VRLKNCQRTTVDGDYHPFQSGIVYRIYGNRLFVAAKGGSIVVESVTDEDRELILDQIRMGDRFHTPIEFLEKARTTRVHYSP